MAQRVTWSGAGNGAMISTAAVATELGRTYRITGTVDTRAVPKGTPVEFRIGYDNKLIGSEVDGSPVERSLLGQCVVYAVGAVQEIDIRWTDFTASGTCYFGLYVTGDYTGRSGNLIRPGAGPGDYLILDNLDFQPYEDTLYGQPLDATVQAAEIRRGGVTFSFNRPARIGLYADRSCWFRDIDPGNPTPLRITRIWPECQTYYVDKTPEAGTFRIVPAANPPTPDFFRVHGTEINPWRAGWEWRPDSGVPNVQAFEDRFDTSFHTYRTTLGKGNEPYDTPVYQNRLYDDRFNVDPGRTGKPIDVAPGMSIVKCLSYVEPPSRGPNGARSRLAALIPVTCVASDPPVGAFRPYPGAASKAPTHTLADLDASLLPTLPTVPGAGGPQWHEALRMASYYQPANLRQFPPNEGVVPCLASSVYSLGHTAETASHFMGGLLTDAFTKAQKDRLVPAVVQYGLDLYQDNLIRKIAWAESGGKLCKKPFAVLAALLLKDTAMQATIAASDGQFDVTKNDALPAAQRRWPWYEDCLWGALPAECVTVPRNLYVSRASGKTRAGMKYFPENVGMPSLQDSASPWVPWTGNGTGRDGNPSGQNCWNAAYRTLGTNQALIPILAMHLIPGARAVFANSVVLDWYDMFYRYVVATGAEFTKGMPEFDREFWRRYRSKGAPVAACRLGLDDETDYSITEAAAIMSDDYAAEAGRPMTAADWEGAPPSGVPRIRTFRLGTPMSWPLGPEWFVDKVKLVVSLLDPVTIPTSYAVVSGKLPAGVVLNAATGVLSGTPTEASPLRPDLPPDPTVRAAPAAIRATDIVVRAANAHGASEQPIRFAVLP